MPTSIPTSVEPKEILRLLEAASLAWARGEIRYPWPNLPPGPTFPPQSQDTPADAWHSGGPGACVLGTVKDPARLVQKEPITLWGKRDCFERQVALYKATEMVLGLSFQKGNDPTHGHWAAQHFHR